MLLKNTDFTQKNLIFSTYFHAKIYWTVRNGRIYVFVIGEELTKIQLLLPRLPVVLDREWNIRLLPRISFHRSVRNLIAIYICQVWSITLFKDVSFSIPIHVCNEKKPKHNVIGHT